MMQDAVSEYWIGRQPDGMFSCPNVSLFRFIGSLGLTMPGRTVLEIGFGGNNGADLQEMQRRGASVYGLDINPLYVDSVTFADQAHVRCSRAGMDPIPFDVSFDLIYSRDTLSYLSDEEISFFFRDCHHRSRPEGYVVVQFIETDVALGSPRASTPFDGGFFQGYDVEPIHATTNPIRFLDPEAVSRFATTAGFRRVGSKRLIQSYDLDEQTFRIDKYLAFRRD